MSISIGEEGNKTERGREQGKRQEQVKQGASTDNCVNKGTQANVEGNKDTHVKASASLRCNIIDCGRVSFNVITGCI